MARIIEGRGLLSGPFDPEAFEKREKERQRKQEAEAKREQEQAATCAEMEDYASRAAASELAEENAEIIESYRTGWDAFCKTCRSWDLPSLPAPPQVIAIHLAGISERGMEHVQHAVKAISAAHHHHGHPNPCDDILVRAVIKLCRKEEQKGNE